MLRDKGILVSKSLSLLCRLRDSCLHYGDEEDAKLEDFSGGS